MTSSRQARCTRALLALACWLALLVPGGSGSTVTADPSASPAAGTDQSLLRDRPGGLPVTLGAKRDDRQRPGPSLAGVLAAALATALVWTAVIGRRSDRPRRRRRAAAAGPRAPPALQPAPI